MDISGQEVPTTDAGELPLKIEETTKYGGQFGEIIIIRNAILNQCGTFLTGNKYQLNGRSRYNYFLRIVCETSLGNYIPLIYPEGMISPSIFCKTAPDHLYFVGSIPAPL